MQVKSLAEDLLFTAVRIETQHPGGFEGVGTGFIFGFENGDTVFPYLVTNKHVVEGATRGRLSFVLARGGEPVLGEMTTVGVEDFTKHWSGHPRPEVDIAVLPLGKLLQDLEAQGRPAFFKTIPSSAVPDAARLAELDAIEEVVFVGYPTGLWDRRNGLPIVRRGTTASPVFVDFDGEPRFLVDASVFPGSSGSPVLIYDAGVHANKEGMVIAGSRFLLLGILAAGFFRTEEGAIEERPLPVGTKKVAVLREMIALGVVWRASLVLDLVHDRLVAQGAIR